MLDEPRRAIDARAEQAFDAVEEVPHVPLDMKADEVAGEQTVQQLAVPRQQSVQVERRKRNVQEEREAPGGTALAEPERREHQMIVVHPDQIVGAGDLVCDPGEALVDPLIGLASAARSKRARCGKLWNSGHSVAFANPW